MTSEDLITNPPLWGSIGYWDRAKIIRHIKERPRKSIYIDWSIIGLAEYYNNATAPHLFSGYLSAITVHPFVLNGLESGLNNKGNVYVAIPLPSSFGQYSDLSTLGIFHDKLLLEDHDSKVYDIPISKSPLIIPSKIAYHGDSKVMNPFYLRYQDNCIYTNKGEYFDNCIPELMETMPMFLMPGLTPYEMDTVRMIRAMKMMEAEIIIKNAIQQIKLEYDKTINLIFEKKNEKDHYSPGEESEADQETVCQGTEGSES